MEVRQHERNCSAMLELPLLGISRLCVAGAETVPNGGQRGFFSG
jgi:hypothetical protein